MSLSGKVAVVTGASLGIGAAIAVLFAKEGAQVALVGRNADRLQKIAKQCDAYGKKSLIIKADFAKEAEISSVIPKAAENFGKIDILVNNAGTFSEGKILDGSIQKEYNEIMMINLTAPVMLTSQVAPYLVKTKGNIVNISSGAYYDNATYGMSKAALDFFTRSAALELGASGIRVNSVNPGAVRTEAWGAIEQAETMIETIKKQSALGKIAEPEDVAELALFLASDKAKSITGENYGIDNGFQVKVSSLF